ncbi:hypothetical protein D0Y65_046323 [Glycine soja]|uniref:Reverse transcriptase domain-containing protein n=1 Tax=Glycine soja TaxID=3848 RepID=A0A445G8S0_GLYSO|nr:hypothetical protein D0Y65_046323 [Glycine soja]
MEGDQRTYRKGKAKYSMPTRDEDGGIWKGMDKAINLVNVYSHCAFNEKLALWEELLQLRRTVGEGLWCVVGDFNVIRCLERVGNNGGIQQRGREILEFNNFIENMELVELPSVGRKFSRIKEAEGLSSLVREAEDKDLLAGVKVSNGNLKLPLLQYVDDAIFFFRKGIKDTITLKTILRCFELVTGLKVNFSKSSLVSINVDQRDCLSCARILNCNTMSFPFTYLGLPVGADTRKISTWQPVIDKLKKKLAQWRRRHLSFGGGRLVWGCLEVEPSVTKGSISMGATYGAKDDGGFGEARPKEQYRRWLDLEGECNKNVCGQGSI